MRRSLRNRPFAVLFACYVVASIPGAIPGLSDWRQVQLLVEAGFTPVEALRVATHNGARFLGLEHRIGSVAPGLDADLVVVRGNPAVTIQDLEKVELVFKGEQPFVRRVQDDDAGGLRGSSEVARPGAAGVVSTQRPAATDTRVSGRVWRRAR